MSSITLFGLYLASWLFIVLFGSALIKVGLPYWETIRFAPFTEFQSAWNTATSAILVIVLALLLLSRFAARLTGAELEERFLAGRLRLPAWWRRGLRERNARSLPTTIDLDD